MDFEDDEGGLFDFSAIENVESDRAEAVPRWELERQRAPIIWTSRNNTRRVTNETAGSATGIFYGLEFPVSEHSLHMLGSEWLTTAMQAAGTLATGNRILSLERIERLGNSLGGAIRLLITVAYAYDHYSLHKKLLVKIGITERVAHGSKEQTQLKEKRQHLDEAESDSESDASQDNDIYQRRMSQNKSHVPFPFEPLTAFDQFTEINFYRLCEDKSPYDMPKFYYGDICSKTGKSLLITEFIPSPKDIVALHNLKYVQTCFIQADDYFLCCNTYMFGSVLLSHAVQCGAPTTWTLECHDLDHMIFFLRSSDDSYLAIRTGQGECHITCMIWAELERIGVQLAQWTFIPEPGKYDQYRLKSSNDNYLTISNNAIRLTLEFSRAKVWHVQPCEQQIPDSQFLHADLKDMCYTDCHTIMKCGARLAGLYKAGELGCPDLLNQSFKKPAANSQDSCAGALSDTAYLMKAARAQDFLCRVGVAAFPPGTINRGLMKEYRSMLAIVQANLARIIWYLGFQDDYVALGRGRMDTDSAFSSHRSRWTCGFRDWEGVSVGPLGSKIWDWLRYADLAIFENSIDELLKQFIRTYRENGGPELDFPVLRVHLLLAAALESVLLLDSIDEIYEACPQQDWSSIKSLSDNRIAEVVTHCGSLWQCVKSFANLVSLLKNFRVSEVFYVIITNISSWYLTVSEQMSFGRVIRDTHLRDGPSTSSALLACLPLGTYVTYVGSLSTSAQEDMAGYVEIIIPAFGWINVEHVEMVKDSEKLPGPGGGNADGGALALMQNTRRQFFGNNTGMSVMAAVKLYDEFLSTEPLTNVMANMKHGQPRIVHGSFLAQKERCDWWPEDYEHWAYHSFVVFEDGSIADIAAHTFDDVPQLWFPADRSRYEFDCTKADEACRVREVIVGIDKWKELSRSSGSCRSEYEWWLTGSGHTTLDILQNDSPDGAQETALAKNSSNVAGNVFRYGSPMPLPRVSRRVNFEGRSLGVRQLTDPGELEVSLIENLLRDEDVDLLLQCCKTRNGFQPSLVTTSDAKGVQGSQRTSWSCAMHWHGTASREYLDGWRAQWDMSEEQQDKEVQAVQDVTRLFAKVLDVDAPYIEPLQLVKYTPGQFFRPHLDAHRERKNTFCGEQRTHTLLIFLNDVPASDGGGCLHFPILKLRVRPCKGSAVLWKNLRPDGSPDPDSLHEGEAPNNCEKFAMNVWVVDQPLNGAELFTARSKPKVDIAPAASQMLCSGTASEVTVLGPVALYEVVHPRVVIRNAPATDSVIRLVEKEGKKVSGTPYDVKGHPWLKLSKQSCKERGLKSGEAWMLMHGASLGLGDLLKLVENRLAPAAAEDVEAPAAAEDVEAAMPQVLETAADSQSCVSTNEATQSEQVGKAQEVSCTSSSTLDGASNPDETDIRVWMQRVRSTRKFTKGDFMGSSFGELDRWSQGKPTAFAGWVENLLGRT